MRASLFVVLAALPCAAAEPSPEVQIALTSLRPGERARVEKALGPADALPLYRAELEVEPSLRKVTGKVVVTLTAGKEPIDEIYLRATPNALHPGAVTLSKAKLNGAPVGLSTPDPSLYRVRVDPPVHEGAVTLELELKALVPPLEGHESPGTPGEGGDYGAFSVAPDMMNLAGILPMVPPDGADGNLAEGPSGIGDLGTFAPSNFLVSVAAPGGWRVLAPGNAVGEVPDRSGKVRFAYAIAAARELPLFVVKGFESAVRTQGETTVEAWYSAADAKAGKHVLEHAAKALELLEQKLGPYPYRTLRVVEMRLVNGAGGMEFPGLVTVSASLMKGAIDPLSALNIPGLQVDPAIAMLFGPMVQPLLKNTLEFTVDHEVAHQYFAMLVGSDPIQEPVADEALAQHVALLLLEWRQGKAAADAMRDGQLKAAYQLHRFMGGRDKPANRPTHEFGSSTEYAALVYGKAPLLFDAQRKVVGEATWERGLKSYVEENRYRWVRAGTFTEHVAKLNGSGAKLRELKRRWWDEAHGDEDLGGLDLEALLGGNGAMKGVDPSVLKQYEKAMKALMGED